MGAASARSARRFEDDREVVFGRLVPLVIRWCVRLGGGRIDAEAAAGDVMLVLVRRWADRDPERPVEPWAWGVTCNIVARHRRQAWWRRWIPGITGPEAAGGGRENESREASRLVHRVLDELSDDHRAILVLMDLEERAASEAALLLGVPEGTARSRLRAARQAFRAEADRIGVPFFDLVEDAPDA